MFYLLFFIFFFGISQSSATTQIVLDTDKMDEKDIQKVLSAMSYKDEQRVLEVIEKMSEDASPEEIIQRAAQAGIQDALTDYLQNGPNLQVIVGPQKLLDQQNHIAEKSAHRIAHYMKDHYIRIHNSSDQGFVFVQEAFLNFRDILVKFRNSLPYTPPLGKIAFNHFSDREKFLNNFSKIVENLKQRNFFTPPTQEEIELYAREPYCKSSYIEMGEYLEEIIADNYIFLITLLKKMRGPIDFRYAMRQSCEKLCVTFERILHIDDQYREIVLKGAYGMMELIRYQMVKPRSDFENFSDTRDTRIKDLEAKIANIVLRNNENIKKIHLQKKEEKAQHQKNLKEKLSKKTKELNHVKQEQAQVIQALDELKSQIALLQIKLKSEQEKNNTSTTQDQNIKDLKNTINNLRSAKDEKDKKLKEQSQKIAVLEKERTENQEKLKINAQELEQRQQIIQNQKKELTKSRIDQNNFKALEEKVKETQDKLDQSSQTTSSLQITWNDSLEKLKEQIEVITDSKNSLMKKNESLKAQIEENELLKAQIKENELLKARIAELEKKPQQPMPPSVEKQHLEYNKLRLRSAALGDYLTRSKGTGMDALLKLAQDSEHQDFFKDLLANYYADQKVYILQQELKEEKNRNSFLQQQLKVREQALEAREQELTGVYHTLHYVKTHFSDLKPQSALEARVLQLEADNQRMHQNMEVLQGYVYSSNINQSPQPTPSNQRSNIPGSTKRKPRLPAFSH